MSGAESSKLEVGASYSPHDGASSPLLETGAMVSPPLGADAAKQEIGAWYSPYSGASAAKFEVGIWISLIPVPTSTLSIAVTEGADRALAVLLGPGEFVIAATEAPDSVYIPMGYRFTIDIQGRDADSMSMILSNPNGWMDCPVNSDVWTDCTPKTDAWTDCPPKTTTWTDS